MNKEIISGYKVLLRRNSIDEFDDRTEVDYKIHEYRRTNKQFQTQISVKVKPPTKRNSFYNLGEINLSFSAFEHPSSYVIEVFATIGTRRYNYEQIPEIVRNTIRDLVKELFIDDLGFKKEHAFKYYIIRKSDMTKEEFTEVVDLITEELNERLND